MLWEQLSKLDEAVQETIRILPRDPSIEESGTVLSVDKGIALVLGLYSVKNQELIEFPRNTMGMVFNLDPEVIGVILLGNYDHIQAGDQVRRTYRVADIPVSEDLLGRVINPLGEVIDDQRRPIEEKERLPIEQEAVPIMHRAPVYEPLQTGIKVIDSVVPIGRGQRELILGDRQTGKTAIAIDTIINQKDTDVICIYCAVGKRTSSITQIVRTLREHGALAYSIIMVAGSEEPPGISFIAPYAATSIGEYFMRKGKNVLIVYDDLTRHARAYRELSLLLERPPGREAYPGDIFYIHSRLLERATHLTHEFGGGSITALPIIETQAENLSAYIPTNLISITDGQIYLSPKLYQKGNLPAVSIGTSVSRVGGKTQLPAYRAITSALKLTYSQFEELERFSSFGSRLDEETRKILDKGQRIRRVLSQVQYEPIEVTEQMGLLLAVVSGALDPVALDDIEKAEEIIRQLVREDDELQKAMKGSKPLEDEVKEAFIKQVEEILKKELVE
ncbi:F0F1 ATP synthase subunit alpha [Clostridia bacterium]|nr:F0F1 ATP synthase subunit alpha [Clostridia bacterium]